MKIVAISDTHERWLGVEIPECDILISAGDYSFRGEPNIVEAYHRWLSWQPAKHIISVQGNHECWVESNWLDAKALVENINSRIRFVHEELIEINGYKIYCSAATPMFYNWSYMIDRGEPMRKHWAKIPDDIDVLVTHGPPFGILDTSPLGIARENPHEHLGCVQLADRIGDLKNLKLHIFGHIHGSSGILQVGDITYVNAAICDERYKPTNPPRIVEI